MGMGVARRRLPYNDVEFVTALLITAFFWVFLALLLWNGAVSWHHYTYWSFAAYTAVSPALVVAAFWPWLQRVLWRWWVPLWHGTAWLVFWGSTVMITDNGNIFLQNTTAGTPAGPATVGLVFMAEVVVHVMPAFLVLVYCAVVWSGLQRMHAHELTVAVARGSFWSVCTPVGHTLYFLFAPIALFAIYTLVEDVAFQYPTYFPASAAVLITVTVTVVLQAALHAVLLRTGIQWESLPEAAAGSPLARPHPL